MVMGSQTPLNALAFDLRRAEAGAILSLFIFARGQVEPGCVAWGARGLWLTRGWKWWTRLGEFLGRDLTTVEGRLGPMDRLAAR